MSQHQLKLAYVNLKVLSNPRHKNGTSTAASSHAPMNSHDPSRCSLERKAGRLRALAPRAAELVEGLIDDLIFEAEGRKL